jgi:hypothetical protein
MKSRLTRVAVGIALAAPVLGIAASPASAETVVMGSPLVSNYDGGISASALSAQLSFDPATSTNPVISPANGLITGWKVKSADDGAVYTLKVLRPNGAVSIVPPNTSNFTAVASVQAPTAVPNGTFAATPTGVVFDYPASLPISKGDYIGLLGVGGPGAHGLAQAMANGLPLSTFANNFAGQPADGAAADLIADSQHELLLQATISYCLIPNVLGLEDADAGRAIARAGCNTKFSKQQLQLRKIKKRFSEKKKKRIRASNAALRAQDGKVLSQSVPADTTIPPGTAVDCTVGQVVEPPKKKHKKKQ